jgi:hypothetical protein
MFLGLRRKHNHGLHHLSITHPPLHLMGNMVRAKARSAEEKRQLGDRNRALHSQAYRFMVTTQRQSGQIPSTEQLAEWLKEMGKAPRVGALIKNMVKHGWLLPWGGGYKLRTQQSLEAVLSAIIEAYESKQHNIVRALIAQHKANGGLSTPKAGRSPRSPGTRRGTK